MPGHRMAIGITNILLMEKGSGRANRDGVASLRSVKLAIK
jgi:hypothetical protein